jgi:hypothetical protein
MIRLSIIVLILFSIVGCGTNTETGTFNAMGSGENWRIHVLYTLDNELINSEGQLTYLAVSPPDEITYEFIYPNGFPTGEKGTISHYYLK